MVHGGSQQYPDFTLSEQGIDLIWESVGGEMFTTCTRALAQGGRLLVIGMMSQYSDGWGASQVITVPTPHAPHCPEEASGTRQAQIQWCCHSCTRGLCSNACSLHLLLQSAQAHAPTRPNGQPSTQDADAGR